MNALLLASHFNDGGHFPWFPWFPVVPLFFVGAWVVVLVTVGRRWRRSQRPAAESVLAERYARGEIDEGEYRDRLAVLRRVP